jgi:hypothetical protein
MVERPLIIFSIKKKKKKKKLTRSWPVDWRGSFGHGIKWDAPSSFGLWA